MSGSKTLVASAVAALMAVTGCTSPRSWKKVEKERPEAGQTDEPVATAAASQSVAQDTVNSAGKEDIGKPAEKETGPEPGRGGIAAIEGAAEAGKYLFVFFRRDDDEQTRKMREVFDATMKKVAGRAEPIVIDVSDPSEKEIVDRFQVRRAPTPLVLALAPNGAVTGGFPMEFDENQLVGAFASPCMEKCLKTLQEGKLTLVCVQNAATKAGDAAMKGVKDFRADSRFARATEVVIVDPSNAAESRFLAQLGVAPETTEATTVLLVPPGRVVAKLKGATSKDELVAALQACATGCGPSAGSTGAT